jgi:hypothetical protein
MEFRIGRVTIVNVLVILLRRRTDIMEQIVVSILPKTAKDCPYSEYWWVCNKHACIFKRGMYCQCSLETGDKCTYLVEKESEE